MENRDEPADLQGDFLFINKDSQSLPRSQKSKSAATSINRHVQRWQQQRSRGHQTSANQYRPFVPTLRVPAILAKPKEQGGQCKARVAGRDDYLPIAAGPSASHQLGTFAFPQGNAMPDDTDSNHLVAAATEVVSCKKSLHEFPLLLANFSASDCIDPFNSTALPLDYRTQPVLQHYLDSVSVPSYRRCLSKNCLTEHSHTSAVLDLFRGSLYDKTHMYALLSVSSIRMSTVFGIRLKQNPAYFNYKAIRCLREHMSSVKMVSDPRMLLNVYYLGICEWFVRNYDAARMHLSFLSQFWNPLSTLSSEFEHYLHDMVCYNDVFLALAMNKPPIFPLDWEPEPLSDKRMAEIRVELRTVMADSGIFSGFPSGLPSHAISQYIGSGLVEAAEADLFSPGMTAILFETLPLCQVARCAQVLPTTSAIEMQWISRKSQALLHRLLSLSAEGYEDCLRITLLIILTCLSASKAWRLASGKVDLPKLASRLRFCLERVWDEDVHSRTENLKVNPQTATLMRMWICLTGAFAAEGCHDGQEWFLAEAAQIASSTELNTNAQLQEALESFIFFEDMQGLCLR